MRLVLIQDHAVDHGVNKAVFEAGRDERALRAFGFQHAEIGKNFRRLADRRASHTKFRGQLRLGRDFVAGL